MTQTKTVPVEAPEGHCSDPAAWAEFHRQYGGQPRSYGHMTDFQLANAVFMADRNDLNLIHMQTAAKERIRWLSLELAKALAAAPKAEPVSDPYKLDVLPLGTPVEVDFKEAEVGRQTLYVAGVTADDPNNHHPSYWLSETWPVKCRGDVSDGWDRSHFTVQAQLLSNPQQLPEAQKGESVAYPVTSAPRNHTWVRLLVDYSGEERPEPLEDADTAWSIGFNGFDHDGEDNWQFVGWDWSHDVIVKGSGKIIGWLPFHTHPAPSSELPESIRDIAAERRRQVDDEGYSHSRDDGYELGELGLAAALYALPYEADQGGEKFLSQDDFIGLHVALDIGCGWVLKPDSDRRRRLVKAGALVAAEIERLDRIAKHKGPQS